MGLGDGFFELLDFELILEEEWEIGGDFCWFLMRAVDLVDWGGRHGVACGSLEGRKEEEKRRKKYEELRFL